MTKEKSPKKSIFVSIDEEIFFSTTTIFISFHFLYLWKPKPGRKRPLINLAMPAKKYKNIKNQTNQMEKNEHQQEF